MRIMTTTAKPAKVQPHPDKDALAMPFNEALKRVWAAPPMPHIKKKPAAKVIAKGAKKEAQG